MKQAVGEPDTFLKSLVDADDLFHLKVKLKASYISNYPTLDRKTVRAHNYGKCGNNSSVHLHLPFQQSLIGSLATTCLMLDCS